MSSLVEVQTSVEERADTDCTNCGTPLREGAFCSFCGQKKFVGRITVKGTLSEAFRGIFSVERGLWFTVKQMCLRPGQAIAEYVSGAIKKYYNPFKFLLLTATLGTLSNYLVRDQMGQLMPSNDVTIDGEQVDFAQVALGLIFEHYVIFTISFLPILAIFTWLFFYRTEKNLAESIVYNAYLIGIYTLLYGTVGVALVLIGVDIGLISALSALLLFVLYVWAAKDFYQVRWLTSIWKNAVILLVGYLGSVVVATVCVAIYLHYIGRWP